jgi:tetratricopeptide (TPR) repeat protein
MAKLSRKYPDDPNAAAFYALSILGTAHEGRDFAIYMRAAGVLEEVFPNHLKHPGIVHYLIHSYDDPIHAPLGLRAARIYSRIAPSAAHAQHMTSHIYLPLGMWDEVVEANENATGVVNRKAAAKGEPPRYYGHYNFWLEYGYLQQGRYGEAKRLLKGCYEHLKQGESAHRHMAVMDALDPDNSSLGSFIQMRLRYLLETGDWGGEVANWETPLGEDLAPRLTHEFTSGFGAVQRGKAADARSALQHLKETRRELESYLKKQSSPDPSYTQRAEILEEQLQAMIWFVEGMTEQAVDLLRKAAKTENSMALAFGPPFVDKPTHELLGEILLKMNRPLEATAAFEAALAQTPLRTASLLGLARAATQSGDKQKAEETSNLLRRIWKHAEQSVKESLPQGH